MLATFLLLGAFGLGPATAQAQALAEPRPWVASVRCAALSERMPAMMDASLRLIEATPVQETSITPEMAAMMDAAKKLMVASRPMLVEMIPLMHDLSKEEVKTGLGPGATQAKADEVFLRELRAARSEYARFDFRDVSQSGLDAFKVELDRQCKPADAKR